MTRQYTELTLVISTVQLRLVVRVTEWDSAVSGMVMDAGNYYKIEMEKHKPDMNKASRSSKKGFNTANLIQMKIFTKQFSTHFNILGKLLARNSQNICENKSTYFALCHTRGHREFSDCSSEFGWEASLKPRLLIYTSHRRFRKKMHENMQITSSLKNDNNVGM